MDTVKRKVTLDGELCFPNEYLCCADLKGREANVTIASVTREMLATTTGQKQAKLVIRFTESSAKKFVVNKTNASSIAALHGAEASEWVGKRVTLYPTRCAAFGETVECIRVRDKAPSTKAPAPKPAPPPTEGLADEGVTP